MTLPNAAKGVKKLFIAEVLNIISIILMLFAIAALGAAVGLSESGYMGAASGFALGGYITLFADAILPIIAIILILVGLRQASKDEHDRMNKAFWFGIATLVFSLLAVFFKNMHWGGQAFFSACGTITEICMFIFAIMGVSEVTQNISRQDVADMGPKIMVIVIIAAVFSLIAGIIGNVIGGVAAMIALVLMLIAYVVFVVFLARASSALANG